ncbi:MAG: protein phosphatase 2C domain-containing protein [Cyanobacteria bacterium J06600_6]
MWSSEKAVTPQQKETLVSERYFALTEQIFLDTQPSKPPLTPEEVPSKIVIYLQLFAHYPHIPQPHGLLNDKQTWLFEYGTIPASETGKLVYPLNLIPKIEDLWSAATALKQLNWLWQIAKLWHPLAFKGVASTLLDPNLIRINGQILQLIQLKSDSEEPASLQDLGKLWTRWASNIHPDIKEVVTHLASNLETGVISQASQLVGLLDKTIALYSKSLEYSYQICALSDSGPSRSNNEDAAYPPSAHTQNLATASSGLAIVCDGVGGHDGGEIASTETIKYLQGKISALKLDELSSVQISRKLAHYMNGANDIISERNDVEQRQERQRMGTTLVMALASAEEVYLSHVGDSRIYFITPDSCHQMTVDDDLASREVRLGYALYRDSLQYPSAGALIQALGMRDSAALHPNLQRLIVDDECIFLLCTDGLSDFDRVEQQWRKKILPVLEGEQNLVSAVKELIALANVQNGHDNVTVALVHCKVKASGDRSQLPVSWSVMEPILAESTLWTEAAPSDSFWSDSALEPTSQAPTAISDTPTIGESSTEKKQPGWIKTLIFVLLLFTIIGLFVNKALQNRLEDPDNDLQSPTSDTTEIEPGLDSELLDSDA